MAKFERSRERKGKRDRRDSRDRSDRGSRDFRGSRGRSFGRDRGRSRDRRPLEMTKVICASCKKECEVPFKPTSD